MDASLPTWTVNSDGVTLGFGGAESKRKFLLCNVITKIIISFSFTYMQLTISVLREVCMHPHAFCVILIRKVSDSMIPWSRKRKLSRRWATRGGLISMQLLPFTFANFSYKRTLITLIFKVGWVSN